MISGEVSLTATIDFDEAGGSWDVTDGVDVLGCSGGSFTEDGFAAGIERTMSCDAGARSGTIVLRFNPEPVAPGSDEFASDWIVHAATGDFAGLDGGGDWSGMINDDGSGAEETWTGSIEFGDPGERADEGPSAEPFDGVLDEAFLVGLMERLDVPDDAEGTVAVTVIDADGDSVSAIDGNAVDGSAPDPGGPMRVGSITKVFTSLATLSLVADGLVALDDAVTTHVDRVEVPDGVTIRELLQHTSGIPEHVGADGFFEALDEDRARVWTPEEAMAFTDGLDADFEPGAEFGYSNSNYIVLGVLIEEVTGRPAHEVIRDRVIDVVDMPSTYLAGVEDGPAPVTGIGAFPGQPAEPTDSAYTSIATAAWTAGAMVSTGEDLHRLFSALFAGDIVPDDLVAEMIANEEYGLGIEPWDADDSLVGHGGSIIGSHTLVFHDPASSQTAFWASTSDALSWAPIVDDVVMAMVPGLETDDR